MKTPMDTRSLYPRRPMHDLVHMQQALIPALQRQHLTQFADSTEAERLASQNALLRRIISRTMELLTDCGERRLPD